MQAIRRLCIFVAALLCGCSSVDGLYTPACMAYEGDEIELEDSRFTWRRFTDQRHIDENGEPVDAFPGFPKTGRYVYHDAQLDLIPDDGQAMVSFYIQNESRSKYLLTTTENAQFEHDRIMPECALRREK